MSGGRKSYLALVEYFNTAGELETIHREFFSSKARITSPKTIEKADQWIAAVLRENGTDNCRASVSEVLWSIA